MFKEKGDRGVYLNEQGEL